MRMNTQVYNVFHDTFEKIKCELRAKLRSVVCSRTPMFHRLHALMPTQTLLSHNLRSRPILNYKVFHLFLIFIVCGLPAHIHIHIVCGLLLSCCIFIKSFIYLITLHNTLHYITLHIHFITISFNSYQLLI